MLTFLKAHSAEWVANTMLASPEIGGLEAMRRLRELRKMGHTIEKRHLTGGIWEYRYLPSAE